MPDLPMLGNRSLKQDVAAFYDDYHSQRMREPNQYWLSRVWSYFDGKVLEVGAGRLFWSAEPPSEYAVIDISIEAMRQAASRGIGGALGDGEALPFRDRSFDLVTCHDVLEHMVSPDRLMSEICRVSRKRALVASPNYVEHDYAPGFDCYLPVRAARFISGSARDRQAIEGAHLSFDAQWQPDRDALSAANSSWVAQQMRLNGFRPITVETWPKGFRLLNRIPVVRHLGPFMLIVGDAIT